MFFFGCEFSLFFFGREGEFLIGEGEFFFFWREEFFGGDFVFGVFFFLGGGVFFGVRSFFEFFF